jgi:hypothetical protein
MCEVHKNDFVDAEAIAEPVECKNMQLVPIKTDDQLDLQAIHRVRDRLVSRGTALFKNAAHRVSQAGDQFGIAAVDVHPISDKARFWLKRVSRLRREEDNSRHDERCPCRDRKPIGCLILFHGS